MQKNNYISLKYPNFSICRAYGCWKSFVNTPKLSRSTIFKTDPKRINGFRLIPAYNCQPYRYIPSPHKNLERIIGGAASNQHLATIYFARPASISIGCGTKCAEIFPPLGLQYFTHSKQGGSCLRRKSFGIHPGAFLQVSAFKCSRLLLRSYASHISHSAKIFLLRC